MNAKSLLCRLARPILRCKGFQNTGLVWNRNVDGIIQVFDFQLHRYGGSTSTQVTTNLGLCHPDVWSLTWGQEHKGIYEETDCCPRVRVGYLLSDENPKYRDIWWTIEDGDEHVARNVVDLVADRCIPFLDRHSDLSTMQAIATRFLKKMALADKLYLAVINHLLGHTDERDALFALLQSKRAATWSDRIGEVRQRLGLTENK